MHPKDLFKIIKNQKKVAVYGNGALGKRVGKCLISTGIVISCYIVTDKPQEITTESDGVPIISILELPDSYMNNAVVIVAVNEKHFLAIRKTIEQRFGERHYNNVIYLSEKDICELNRECFPLSVNRFLVDTEPVSRLYGNDRGTPIDRYYIEKFLLEESSKIRKEGMRVLEVGEDTYSRKYFPECIYEMLNYSEGMDLTIDGTIQENYYDVFIATQVFHQIYQVEKAIAGASRLLKKGGVMLATVCGTIVKPARNEEYDHYWGFTIPSITNLMKEVFNGELRIQSFGNVAVATAFIQGVAAEELSISVMEVNDPNYPVCISIFARKE